MCKSASGGEYLCKAWHARDSLKGRENNRQALWNEHRIYRTDLQYSKQFMLIACLYLNSCSVVFVITSLLPVIQWDYIWSTPNLLLLLVPTTWLLSQYMFGPRMSAMLPRLTCSSQTQGISRSLGPSVWWCRPGEPDTCCPMDLYRS